MSVALACADETGPYQRLHPVPTAGEGPELDDEGSENGEVRPRRCHVLITDDNAGLRQTLVEILTFEGYFVREAANGQAALAILEGTPVDVLILDLAMPLMDGVELLRRIDPPPPVVIIYSAFAYFNADEVRRQVGAKVFKLLRKPLHPSQLVSAVSEAIAELGDE